MTACADNKCGSHDLVFISVRLENIMEKGEIAGNQHFLLFPKYFLKSDNPGSPNLWVVWCYMYLVTELYGITDSATQI